MDQPYWIRHPDGPFITLIAVATTYLHPEADELELLQERAEDHDNDPEMRVFKAELRQAITALKGPLGNIPAFKRKISSLLADDKAREKLVNELGLGIAKEEG